MDLALNSGLGVVAVGNLSGTVYPPKPRYFVNLNLYVSRLSTKDLNHVLLIPWWVEMRLPG